MKNVYQFCLLILMVVVCSPFSMAEQKKVFGNYEVHYIGLTTNYLSKEVAKQYGIVRSRSLGYVSISILKEEQEQAEDAQVSGTMSNLLGQFKSLSFRRIQEGKAIYFISTFSFDETERYQFAIDIDLLGSTQDIALKFQQKFYEES